MICAYNSHALIPLLVSFSDQRAIRHSYRSQLLFIRFSVSLRTQTLLKVTYGNRTNRGIQNLMALVRENVQIILIWKNSGKAPLLIILILVSLGDKLDAFNLRSSSRKARSAQSRPSRKQTLRHPPMQRLRASSRQLQTRFARTSFF